MFAKMLLFFAVFISASFASEKFYGPTEGTITFKQPTPKGDVLVNHYWKEHGQLTATEHKGPLPDGTQRNTLYIWDVPGKKSYTVHHHLKVLIAQSGEDAEKPRFYKKELLDQLKKEPAIKILGHDVPGYSSDGTILYVWEGILVKYVQDGKVVSEAVKADLGPVDAKIFTPPTNYQNK